MSLKIITSEQYKLSTWKNGLGFTREIAIFPPDANLAKGNFLWRLSSAQIEKASPFSLFPAHDRVLLILKGEGMRLIHTFSEGDDDEVVELPPLEPYEFPGDVPSRCELLDGAIVDFSIFVRKAEVEPQVQIVNLEANQSFKWSPEGRWNFTFVVSGSAETEVGALSEGNTLSLEYSSPDAERKEIRLQASQNGSTLLLVSLG